MSFPMGVTLFSPQNPKDLPPFTIYLSPANGWKVVQPNGVYAPAGDTLWFFAGQNQPYIMGEPGPNPASPNINASNMLLSPPASASFVGMPLVITFDQEAFAIGDNHKSGTVYAPPSNVGLYGSYATITIPAGELLLMASWGLNTPCTQAFICPASYAVRMAWQITSIGG
jgi:hypothetical protein